MVLSEQLIGHDAQGFRRAGVPALRSHLHAGGLREERRHAERHRDHRPAQQRAARVPLQPVRHRLRHNGKARHYTVKSVTDESGKELSFVHRNDELLVGLPEAAPANSPFKLKFEIAGDFLIRPSGDSYWELGTEPWFPQPELNGQYYTFHSR